MTGPFAGNVKDEVNLQKITIDIFNAGGSFV
jgi:hypothetical protein